MSRFALVIFFLVGVDCGRAYATHFFSLPNGLGEVAWDRVAEGSAGSAFLSDLPAPFAGTGGVVDFDLRDSGFGTLGLTPLNEDLGRVVFHFTGSVDETGLHFVSSGASDWFDEDGNLKPGFYDFSSGFGAPARGVSSVEPFDAYAVGFGPVDIASMMASQFFAGSSVSSLSPSATGSFGLIVVGGAASAVMAFAVALFVGLRRRAVRICAYRDALGRRSNRLREWLTFERKNKMVGMTSFHRRRLKSNY